jgi:hypothetical protein
MVTVGVVADVVERRLAAGRLRCPGCPGRLAGWGHARERVIRGQGGIGWRLRPRRSRCGGCRVTHVLLPVSCLLRRADGVAVIWAALACKAAGLGYRPIAAGLGRPASTVRGWLARFASRAELVRGLFTVWLCALDADPPPLAPASSVVADTGRCAAIKGDCHHYGQGGACGHLVKKADPGRTVDVNSLLELPRWSPVVV